MWGKWPKMATTWHQNGNVWGMTMMAKVVRKKKGDFYYIFGTHFQDFPGLEKSFLIFAASIEQDMSNSRKSVTWSAVPHALLLVS